LALAIRLALNNINARLDPAATPPPTRQPHHRDPHHPRPELRHGLRLIKGTEGLNYPRVAAYRLDRLEADDSYGGASRDGDQEVQVRIDEATRAVTVTETSRDPVTYTIPQERWRLWGGSRVSLLWFSLRTDQTRLAGLIYRRGDQVFGRLSIREGRPWRQRYALTGAPVDSGPAGLLYLHTDHLDTVQVITDRDRRIVWKGAQKPFGETEAIIDLVDNPLRFPGQCYDAETGLHYNYFRDYDPKIGRYVQSDPVGIWDDLNTYNYVFSSPVQAFDIFGLERSGRNARNFKQTPCFCGIDDPCLVALICGSVGGAATGTVAGAAAGATTTLGVGAGPGALIGGVGGTIVGGFSGVLLCADNQTGAETVAAGALAGGIAGKGTVGGVVGGITGATMNRALKEGAGVSPSVSGIASGAAGGLAGGLVAGSRAGALGAVSGGAGGATMGACEEILSSRGNCECQCKPSR
jgi:RHS repeat-associated protein